MSSFSRSVSLSTWNISDLVDGVLGNKFKNEDFLNHVNRFDLIFLTETWTRKTVFVPGFKCFITQLQSNISKGRLSGSIIILLLYKDCLPFYITIEKTSNNLKCCNVDKVLIGMKQHKLFIYVEIHPTRKLKIFFPTNF